MAAQHNIAAVIQVFKVDNGMAAAIQDHVLLLFTQAVKGHIQLKIVVFRQCFEHLKIIEVTFIPTPDRPAGQTQLITDHHFFRIEELLDAQTIAAGAGAGRVIKGKQPWLQLGHGVTASRAGIVGGKHQLFSIRLVHQRHPRHAARQLQCGFERLGQPQLNIIPHLNAVYHHFNGVLFLQI